MLIRQKDKEKISEIARKVFDYPLEIWAYGSRVNGNAHDTSDLDMVLVSKPSHTVSSKELHTFKKYLQQSTIPILTQVIDWHRVPENFRKEILEQYEMLVKIDVA